MRNTTTQARRVLCTMRYAAFCLRPTMADISQILLNNMKSVAILAALAGSAAAFAPAQTGRASTAVNGYESEPAASNLLVDAEGYWDPLNLVYNQPQEKFDRLRYVEIKHGRIAMLAFLGHVVTSAGVRLPGEIAHGVKFADLGVGWGATTQVPVEGALQILAFVGVLEVFVMKDSANGAKPGEFTGDFRNGFLDFGWDMFSDEEKLSKRAIEINNGRAAMMGILGLMVHEQLPGDTYVANALMGYPTQ